MDAIRQWLEANKDEKLEDQMSLLITLKEDCPPQLLSNHAIAQALAREILGSSGAALAKKHQQGQL